MDWNWYWKFLSLSEYFCNNEIAPVIIITDKAKTNELDNFSLKVDLNRKVRNMNKAATVAA